MSDKNWMRGHCWDMALALQECTGLPLYGLFDAKGTCHHALVWDERVGVGIDARGAKLPQHLRLGCAGAELKPLTRESIEAPGGWLGRELAKDEISEARKYIRANNVLASWRTFLRLNGLDEPERAPSRSRSARP